MIEVEVVGHWNQYMKAVLRNVINEEAIVFYPELNEEECVPLIRVRLPPIFENNIHPCQNAEVLLSILPSQTKKDVLTCRWGDDVNGKSEIEIVTDGKWDANLSILAWWPCRVVKVRDDIVVIKLNPSIEDGIVNSEKSLNNQLSAVTDIVSRNILRPSSENAPCLTSESIHRHYIEINKELSDFASDPSVHEDFLRYCGGPTSHFYDPQSSSLVVLSVDAFTSTNVALLQEIHLRMLRQKWVLTRSLRNTIRSLEVNKKSSDQFRQGPGESNVRFNNTWFPDPKNFIEKFYVPQHLMGLAIGSHGANIRAAREIPDVIRIVQWDQGDLGRKELEVDVQSGLDNDSVLFCIEAKTQEAAKQARSALEFTELYLCIPHRYVSRLIGRYTANILSIIEKSRVVNIYFDDSINELAESFNDVNLAKDGSDVMIGSDVIKFGRSRSRNMKRLFLKIGGTHPLNQPAENEEYVGVILVGTSDSIEKARLLISFQLDYFYELEKIEDEKLELLRSLAQNDAPNLNNTTRNSGPNRWNERDAGAWNRGGGGSRGGRYPGRGGASLLHDHLAPDYAVGGPNSNPMMSNDENRNYSMQHRGRRPQQPREALHPPRGGGGANGFRSGRGAGNPRYANADNNDDVTDRRRGSDDSESIWEEEEYPSAGGGRSVQTKGRRGGRGGSTRRRNRHANGFSSEQGGPTRWERRLQDGGAVADDDDDLSDELGRVSCSVVVDGVNNNRKVVNNNNNNGSSGQLSAPLPRQQQRNPGRTANGQPVANGRNAKLPSGPTINVNSASRQSAVAAEDN